MMFSISRSVPLPRQITGCLKTHPILLGQRSITRPSPLGVPATRNRQAPLEVKVATLVRGPGRLKKSEQAVPPLARATAR